MVSVGGDLYFGGFLTGQAIFGFSTTSTYWSDVNGGITIYNNIIYIIIEI